MITSNLGTNFPMVILLKKHKRAAEPSFPYSAKKILINYMVIFGISKIHVTQQPREGSGYHSDLIKMTKTRSGRRQCSKFQVGIAPKLARSRDIPKSRFTYTQHTRWTLIIFSTGSLPHVDSLHHAPVFFRDKVIQFWTETYLRFGIYLRVFTSGGVAFSV